MRRLFDQDAPTRGQRMADGTLWLSDGDVPLDRCLSLIANNYSLEDLPRSADTARPKRGSKRISSTLRGRGRSMDKCP